MQELQTATDVVIRTMRKPGESETVVVLGVPELQGWDDRGHHDATCSAARDERGLLLSVSAKKETGADPRTFAVHFDNTLHARAIWLLAHGATVVFTSAPSPCRTDTFNALYSRDFSKLVQEYGACYLTPSSSLRLQMKKR